MVKDINGRYKGMDIKKMRNKEGIREDWRSRGGGEEETEKGII